MSDFGIGKSRDQEVNIAALCSVAHNQNRVLLTAAKGVSFVRHAYILAQSQARTGEATLGCASAAL